MRGAIVSKKRLLIIYTKEKPFNPSLHRLESLNYVASLRIVLQSISTVRGVFS